MGKMGSTPGDTAPLCSQYWASVLDIVVGSGPDRRVRSSVKRVVGRDRRWDHKVVSD